MSDDVVAELDRWLAVWGAHFGGTQSVDMEVVQRARDEIVALRATVERQKLVLSKGHAEVRDTALEEAAQLAHANGFGETAVAIRALKDKT